MTKVGNRLFFLADDGTTGLEPWAGRVSILANRPGRAIGDLRDEVKALSLPRGLSAMLRATLTAAERGLDRGNVYAILALETFILEVRIQSPRWITRESAADLTDFAQQIADLLQGARRPRAVPMPE